MSEVPKHINVPAPEDHAMPDQERAEALRERIITILVDTYETQEVAWGKKPGEKSFRAHIAEQMKIKTTLLSQFLTRMRNDRQILSLDIARDLAQVLGCIQEVEPLFAELKPIPVDRTPRVYALTEQKNIPPGTATYDFLAAALTQITDERPTMNVDMVDLVLLAAQNEGMAELFRSIDEIEMRTSVTNMITDVWRAEVPPWLKKGVTKVLKQLDHMRAKEK